MNYLVAAEAGAGHACELAKALKKLIPLESIYLYPSAFGLDYIDKGKIGFHIPPKGETLIVVSAFAYDRVQAFTKNFDRVIVIMTDSNYMINYKKYNDQFKSFDVFVTNCKIQYAQNAKVYYQPFNLSWCRIKKHPQLTLCHSPFMGERMAEKGTELIINAFNASGCKNDVIVGRRWAECIERKSKCHIFVDQIESKPGIWNNPADWMGGVGKSGLEAMCLKSLTISRGNFKDYDIPKPPVVECTVDDFNDVLREAITNQDFRTEMTEKQYQWAIKYLNPDYAAKRLIQT